MKTGYTKYFDDGQLVMLAYLLFYLSLLLLLYYFLGYEKAFMVLDIPVMIPAFADLHVIVGGYETMINGGDPYLANGFDPWGRLYNYPRWWLLLGYLGLNHGNLFFLGCLMGIGFFIVVFRLLRGLTKSEGLYSALVICSPSSILAIERGNIDVIIFILLAAAVFLYSQDTRFQKLKVFMLVFISAMLKLYPVFAAFIFLKENKKTFIRLFAGLLILFLIYLAVSWSDLVLVFKNTPGAPARSYGTAILPMRVFYSLLGSEHELKPWFRLWGIVIGFSFLLLVTGYCFYKVRQRNVTLNIVQHAEDYALVSFRLGAGIFIGTFALGNNWDYRLIFLIFTIPQLLFWHKHIPEIKTLSFTALATILALVQWNFFSNEWANRIIILNELTAWALVGILIYLFLLSLPAWMKQFLRLSV